MTSASVKAIETNYAGCRFRSRLEARWAVFFDTLGVAWQYEPQGYVIDGRPYLPDFLLTHSGTWVEVKGNPRELDLPFLWEAAAELPTMAPEGGEPMPGLLLLGNIPRPPTLRHYSPRYTEWADWTLSLLTAGMTMNDCCDSSQANLRVGFGSWTKNNRPWFDDYDGCRCALTPARALRPKAAATESCEIDVVDAYRAARSARFEHGETGRP